MIDAQNIIKTWDLKNKRVFLRADLNVPLKKGTILSDFRLQEIQTTLDYLLKHGATIVLATHLGRPKNCEKDLSTIHLVNWFKNNGYDIDFAETIEIAYKKSITPLHQLILLENLRFFPGETTGDKKLAIQLKTLGHYYVNDAFGALHRNHTSTTLVPQLFAIENKSIGFLVEKILQILKKIRSAQNPPFLLIVGGAKVADKIPQLLPLTKIANSMLLAPAIVFSFLAAQSKPVGKSLVDSSVYEICNQIIREAQHTQTKILFPQDYQVAQNTLDGPLSYTTNENITENEIGISIGLKTSETWRKEILNAGTIFFNGSIGFLDKNETLHGQKALFQAMAETDGTTILAGGDSIAAAHILGFANKIDYLISGGGTALVYLGGKPLPGLVALEQNKINVPDKS